MPLQQQSCHYNDWHIVAVKLHVESAAAEICICVSSHVPLLLYSSIAHEQTVTYSLSFRIALRLSTAHEQIVSHFADQWYEYKRRHQSLASGDSDYCYCADVEYQSAAQVLYQQAHTQRALSLSIFERAAALMYSHTYSHSYTRTLPPHTTHTQSHAPVHLQQRHSMLCSPEAVEAWSVTLR
eukprot:876-Heterococcus_DN1.PRE.1